LLLVTQILVDAILVARRCAHLVSSIALRISPIFGPGENPNSIRS
jgi:nucleoside-diphosphate-sugar epimerase